MLSGSALPKLAGVSGSDLIAFRFRDSKHGQGSWKQVPAQLDERKLVDFGSAPADNTVPGSDGTVYGTAAIGQAVLQYADPQTFVGADPDSGLDDDDEVALLALDAGEKAGRHAERPKRTRGSRTQLKITDPLGGPAGFVYLYRSAGATDPTAGKDYVRYEFRLTSGDYKATYKRADGPIRKRRRSPPARMTPASPTAGITTASRSRPVARPPSTSSTASSSASARPRAGAARRPSTMPRGRSSPTSTGRCARSAPTWGRTAAR